jgi:DNA-binding NtrC family response regulator
VAKRDPLMEGLPEADDPDRTALMPEPTASDSIRIVLAGAAGGVAVDLDAPGVWVMGRGGDADIRVDDPSLSRLHARLTIETEGSLSLRLEDLESSNGTHVRGARLAPGEVADVALGEAFDLGEVVAVVQRTANRSRPRRVLGRGELDLRIADECERARSSNRRLSVARVIADGAAPSIDSVLAEMVSASLRSFDVVARMGPSDLALLVFDRTAEEVDGWKGLLEERLDEARIEARIGVVSFPDEAREPEALLELAWKAASGVDDRADEPRASGVILEDPSMLGLHRIADKVAQTDIPILILGETGSGKEVLAEAIFRKSPRRDAPFVKLNCAALSVTLLESELFGHERGAFTGAEQAKKGLFESADGGTVLLDEVGELPLEIQAKLLRVVEERAVLRVGSLTPIAVDVRFIAATNRDLASEVEAGRFRRDLYYRLSGFVLEIPPLRERRSEILPLAKSFADKAIDAGAAELLRGYAWPGNVRELRNVMRRASILCDGSTIRVEHLPLAELRGEMLDVRPQKYAKGTPSASLTPEEAKERDRIIDALEKCIGNQTRAAEMLGISRRKLIDRMERYDVPRPRKRS